MPFAAFRFLILRQPVAALAAAGLFGAALLSIAVVIRAARSPSAPWGRLTALAAASFGIGLAACGWMLAAARFRMLAIALGLEDPTSAPPAKVDLRWLGAVESTYAALVAAGTGLIAGAALLALTAVVAAVPARGRLRGAPRRLVLLLAVAALAASMGNALVRAGTATQELLRWEVPFGERGQAFVAATAAPIEAARVEVAAVAVLACLVSALVTRRRGSAERAFGRRARVGGGVVLALGLAAFVATRAMAYDGRHPLPFDRVEHGCLFQALSPGMPAAAAGEALVEGPVLDLHAGEALIDGRALDSPDDLTTWQSHHQALWQDLTHRPASAMPRVLVVAPAYLGTLEVAIWLRALEPPPGGGFTAVAVEPERRFTTRTLGEITASPHCSAIPLRLDPEGRPLTRWVTWGDVVDAAAEARPSTLGVRLR
jgi:hypothetical protein